MSSCIFKANEREAILETFFLSHPGRKRREEGDYFEVGAVLQHRVPGLRNVVEHAVGLIEFPILNRTKIIGVNSLSTHTFAATKNQTHRTADNLYPTPPLSLTRTNKR